MNNGDPIKNALMLLNGARFYRCALQVNPHHYAATYRGQPQSFNEAEYINALIEKAVAESIAVLALTDHNHVGFIDDFRAIANNRGIKVFPGFEIPSREGIHILCLYPLNTPINTLISYLGEFGIHHGDPPSTQISDQPFGAILEKVLKKQGGLAIAAHVTSNNGLFKVLSGQPRIMAWRDPNLLAIQVPGSIEDLPHDVKQIVRNQNSDYQREHPRSRNQAIAVVNARDVFEPSHLSEMSATCWIKMSEISIEGLKQAFLDPASRIRLNTDPEPVEHSELVAIAWEGGFLDGAAIHFNENLNVLIGGRGTGKSTIIESIRYVLGLEPLGEDAKKAYDGIIRQVLESGTKISLLLKSHRPTIQEFFVERTVPNPAIVRDRNGKLLSLSPSDVLPETEVFGQHEISEISKSPEKLTNFIERFVKHAPELVQRKRDIKQKLRLSRERIIKVEFELIQIDESLASLPKLEETLKRYHDAGLEEKLKEQSLLVREERIIKTAKDRIQPFRALLEQLRQELPINRAFVSVKAIEGLPAKEMLSQIDRILEELDQKILKKAKDVEDDIEKALTEIQKVQTRWEERRKVVQADYERILRELQKSRIDGEEFIQIRRQKEELRPLKERQNVLKGDLQKEENHRLELLAEWEEAKRQEFSQIKAVTDNLNRQLAGKVKVSVTYGGHREPVIHYIRNKIRGRLNQALERLREIDQISLQDFASSCREGRDSLVQKYGIMPSQAETLASAPLDVILELQELELPPKTNVELNIAGENQEPIWQRLEDLSTGQKATALLFLLLLRSEAPLLIDQPEDDLDNRFITEGIVPKMREEKRQRQFVFSTHNANIPVLGDAELIIGLSVKAEGGKLKGEISPEHIGSIDDPSVKSLVEEVLEGGREAFEVRRIKYGF